MTRLWGASADDEDQAPEGDYHSVHASHTDHMRHCIRSAPGRRGGAMAPVGTHLRRGIVATVGALVLGSLAPVAIVVDRAAAASDSTSPVVFLTPLDGGTTTSAVHVML